MRLRFFGNLGAVNVRETSDLVSAGADAFRPVVIVPVYNHGATLAGVLDRVAQLGLSILIVNDGSTDETARVAGEWAARHAGTGATVVTHERNCGKAAALRTGFAWAAGRGFTHAATMDADGQLDPEQIPDLLTAARHHPQALVLGRRGADTPGLPRGNLVGWYTSALGLRIETQLTIPDSQCGLRVYPLALTEAVRVRARRFGYEAEIIARAAWSGFDVVEVPVNCHYGEMSRKHSHFRPWLDGAKGFLMHARLTLRRLNPWPVQRNAAERSRGEKVGALSRASIGEQLSLVTLVRQLRRSRLDQLFLAAACGIGAFMAALPLAGWQYLAALYVGLRLRVHFVPLALGTSLAYWGTDKYLQGLGLFVGHAVVHGAAPPLSWWPLAEVGAVGSELIGERVLGGLTVGFFANWVVIGGLVLALRWIPIRRFQHENRRKEYEFWRDRA